MEINEIRELILKDLSSVDQLIYERLQSDVALINQLGLYIINNGGKRVRPMLVLLAAKALGYEGHAHYTLAATVEFIHTATLLHDDVVDESHLRRGQQTANDRFGNSASVLTGDYLYSRAFQMMVDVNNMTVMKILSNATNVIAEGEVMQLMNCKEPDLSVQDYYKVIYCKTAKLFEAAAQLGAVVSGHQAFEENLKTYGMHLGTAFQLIDDALDYKADIAQLGKNVGDDLSEGKNTLPLILAMQHAKPTQREIIRSAILNADGSQFERILSILESTNAIELTVDAARETVHQALAAIDPLPDSVYKTALASLAQFTLVRVS